VHITLLTTGVALPLECTKQGRARLSLSKGWCCATNQSVLLSDSRMSGRPPRVFAVRDPLWHHPLHPALLITTYCDDTSTGKESNLGAFVKPTHCQSSAVAAESWRVGTVRTGYGARRKRCPPTLLAIHR
jgi:hypothetical protein